MQFLKPSLYSSFIVLTLGSLLVTQAQTNNVENDIHVLLLNPYQLSSVVRHQNFASKTSPKGNCFGIDRINYALLTHVSFVSGEKDSPSLIKAKLLASYNGVETSFRSGDRQRINGYRDAQQFSEEMLSTWDEDNNPLRGAIEVVKNQMNSMVTQPRVTHTVGAKGQRLAPLQKQMQGIVRYLMKEVPVRLHLFTNPPHIVTAIGFKFSLDENSKIGEVYVLDSNFPNTLQTLYVREQKGKDGNLRDMWVYGLPTKEGTISYFKMDSIAWDEPYFPEEQKVASEVFDLHFDVNKNKTLTEEDIRALVENKTNFSGK